MEKLRAIHNKKRLFTCRNTKFLLSNNFWSFTFTKTFFLNVQSYIHLSLVNVDTKGTCHGVCIIWVSVLSGLTQKKHHRHMLYWYKDNSRQKCTVGIMTKRQGSETCVVGSWELNFSRSFATVFYGDIIILTPWKSVFIWTGLSLFNIILAHCDKKNRQ